jgi:hypothetical protein
MPPASDYAVMPETDGAVYTRQELDAELVLAPIADKFMLSRRPGTPVVQIVLLAGYVVTGLWLRSLHVPTFAEGGEACVFLVLLAALVPVSFRSPGKLEPRWARAAAVHQESLAGRVPVSAFQQFKAVMGRMTGGTGWQEAWLYVARCTDEEPGHYGVCCAGGTYPRNGRLLVVLGEHLAYGLPELAVAVLAHERRHVTYRRFFLFSLSAIAGTFGLLVAGWAVPWPALLPVAAGVRIGAVAVLWAVEVSCDVGAAREVGAGAMIASIDYKQRTREGARALWPAWRRWTVSALTWASGPEHPPYAVRRWAIHALAR